MEREKMYVLTAEEKILRVNTIEKHRAKPNTQREDKTNP